MNFKNMSIKKSLIVGFGTTILASVLIIIASLVMMNMQKKAYTDILDHYVKTNTLIADCRINYNIAARSPAGTRPGPCRSRRRRSGRGCTRSQSAPPRVLYIAFKIIRSITEPTAQVRGALVGFSQGNLGVPVDFVGKNELGEMCDARSGRGCTRSQSAPPRGCGRSSPLWRSPWPPPSRCSGC